MSSPARPNTPSRRHASRPARRLALTAVLAVGATAAIGLDAAANGPTPHEAPARTVDVRAEDAGVGALVDERLVATALDDALTARSALVATEPEPAPVAPATAPGTEPDPAPAAGPSPSGGAIPLDTWERVAQCESGGNWSIDTGNGFYGGLQFELRSWEWVGGSGYPHEASKEEQIRRAELLHERQGWDAWPACSRKLGLR